MQEVAESLVGAVMSLFMKPRAKENTAAETSAKLDIRVGAHRVSALRRLPVIITTKIYRHSPLPSIASTLTCLFITDACVIQ